MRSYSSLILHGEEDDQQDPLLNQTSMTMDDQIWTPDQDDDINALLHDDSIFYGGGGDLFPSIPDFPAISSSSSSSSTSSAAAVKPAMSTSSSASSSKSSYCYQMVDTPGAPAAGGGALSSTASMRIPELNTTAGTDIDIVDGMDDFGYSDLIGSEDLLMDDPPTCSHHDSIFADDFQPQDGGGDIQEEPTAPAEDNLGEVFLEWLKNNKENVSADDLRRIKIKKSTIDAAAKRLGGGKEAMKKLLKLILEWVQTSHLRPRRTNSNNNNEIISTAEADVATTTDFNNSDPALALPSYDNYPDPTTQINPWAPPVLGYPCGTDPFGNGGGVGPNFNGLDYNPTSSQTQMMIEPAHSWPSSRFPMPPAPPHYAAAAAYEGCLTQPGGISGYLNLNQNQQYSYPYMNLNQNQDQGGGGVDNNNRLVRLGSSATKEARKKRMARQRRFISHRSRHNINPAGLENDERQFDPTLLKQQQQQGNLVYWPLPLQQGVNSGDPTAAPLSVPVDGSAALQQTVDRPPQSHQKQQGGAASEKRKGWKAEKNLRFLLQKVLKQSDVGSLGRIVLPKKEAEMHLPELEARDGISIAMEDIGTSRVWNMRYRFWPNNKSRMYLLESTGDFVRANGLQEGDFIVIYSDVKCGKYLIRGVKVRQPIGLKPESKKATAGHGNKAQKRCSTSLPSATANTSLVNESDRWRSEMTRNPQQITNL